MITNSKRGTSIVILAGMEIGMMVGSEVGGGRGGRGGGRGGYRGWQNFFKFLLMI
jgi:hypothetical protein